ncbi:hypothetical protein G6F50_017062 [Rhizopus delemar]|uniref:Uncharacterized protein n=1 Tax=Rhizopus delemar TaxID=936053 RepID=A0A9P6XRP0_9FUNG|nr:hypothetical protein G6F50_017062 [Rhizopus delemar]
MPSCHHPNRNRPAFAGGGGLRLRGLPGAPRVAGAVGMAGRPGGGPMAAAPADEPAAPPAAQPAGPGGLVARGQDPGLRTHCDASR